MSALAQFIRGLTDPEFAKLESWESGVLDLESIAGGEMALTIAAESAGVVGAGFAAREALRNAVRNRARGHPDFTPPQHAIHAAGALPVRVPMPSTVPFGPRPDDIGSRRRRTGTGRTTFTGGDLPFGPIRGRFEGIGTQPDPSMGERARAAAGAAAAAAAGAAAGAGAAAARAASSAAGAVAEGTLAAGEAALAAGEAAGATAGAVAGEVADVARRIGPRRMAAAAGATGIISTLIPIGGVYKGTLDDGSIIVQPPGEDEDIIIPPPDPSVTPTPGTSPVMPGFMPSLPMPIPGAPGGMTGMGPTRKYRTPRHGRWSYAPFVIAAHGAASHTGLGPANSGLTAARALAAQ